MWLEKIDRITDVLAYKILPVLLLLLVAGVFFVLLFVQTNQGTYMHLHVTPRDGHFDFRVIIPLVFMVWTVYSAYLERKFFPIICYLLTAPFFIGLQFVY